MSLSKLTGPDFDHTTEFVHRDVWVREVYPTWQRLVIGAREHEIGLILELCRAMRGPFVVLYVLLVSRTGRPAGRYESQAATFEALELFLYTFQEYFEQDGRLHLWVMSAGGEGQFVFDHHNVVFAYGDLDTYQSLLQRRGFRQGKLPTPVPHTHNYHAEFDVSETDVLNYWAWRHTSLQPGDDD